MLAWLPLNSVSMLKLRTASCLALFLDPCGRPRACASLLFWVLSTCVYSSSESISWPCTACSSCVFPCESVEGREGVCEERKEKRGEGAVLALLTSCAAILKMSAFLLYASLILFHSFPRARQKVDHALWPPAQALYHTAFLSSFFVQDPVLWLSAQCP